MKKGAWEATGLPSWSETFTPQMWKKFLYFYIRENRFTLN